LRSTKTDLVLAGASQLRTWPLTLMFTRGFLAALRRAGASARQRPGALAEYDRRRCDPAQDIP
jgi:hypothetical protein